MFNKKYLKGICTNCSKLDETLIYAVVSIKDMLADNKRLDFVAHFKYIFTRSY